MKTVKELFAEARFKTYISNIRVKGMHRKTSDDAEEHASEIKRIKNAMEQYPSHDAQVVARQHAEIKKHQKSMSDILNLSNK